MCPVLVLVAAFWLITGFMQLVSALSIHLELPVNCTQFKIKEQEVLPIYMIIDKLPSNTILHQIRFHLSAHFKDPSVVKLYNESVSFTKLKKGEC